MEPRTLVCTDCSESFEFSTVEQLDYQKRGFATPKRCRRCRAVKRKRQVARPASGTPGVGARVGESLAALEIVSQPKRSRTAERHPASCSTCGSPTEVPFRPDGVRPVYCLACLKQRTR